MLDSLDTLVRRVPVLRDGAQPTDLLAKEWLLTNGLGGYSSASVAGLATRKYHGLLVASLPNPLGRTVMLNHLVETVIRENGERIQLSGEETQGDVSLPGVERLREFRLEGGLPVWVFEGGHAVLEKRIVMPHRQNTVFLIWRMLESPEPLKLELRPTVHFRNYEAEVNVAMHRGYRFSLQAETKVYELSCDAEIPPLRLGVRAREASFVEEPREYAELHYRVEFDRGYPHQGRLWSPGTFVASLEQGEELVLVASTEPPEIMNALSATDALDAERIRRRRLLRQAPEKARTGPAGELVLAADQFVIVPAGRRRDAVRATAEGDEIRSVIAGYHWFTDWGRDTMISLEGLTLTTGRVREAASILRTFAMYVKDGLLPNMFPDGSNEGLYHTADATLWFFHSLDRYLKLSGNYPVLVRLLPTMLDIAHHHLQGTHYGIHVDPADGLLTQGQDGYQLTWMDAKCDGWVVTPRRGKAVELNALWYNALCTLASWVREMDGDAAAKPWSEQAARTRASFNRRFWYEEGGYLYDVVDGPQGDSTECRPNQIFSISLGNPVLDQERWPSVMKVVEERLVTPVGLRSLAPGSPGYFKEYFGNLRQRDAAYHQGTVWGWLIGPWVDAWRKTHPLDIEGARRWLDGLIAHIGEFGVGSLAEIFDAEPPYTPRGCIAQAWTVAEVLRCLEATQPKD